MNDVRARFASLASRLRIPVVAAPMFLVSGPELVIAACRAGIVGSFPVPNARTLDELADWLEWIDAGVTARDAPWAVNLVTHRSYDRLSSELELLSAAKPALVITALGDPGAVVDAAHGWGGLVLADVSTVGHAERAVAAGVDGLVVVCAGAGGHTGKYTAFAIVPEIRRRWDVPIVAGGAIGSGDGVHAMRALGADLVYVGTRFIATDESMASERYCDLLVSAGIDDVVTSDEVTGVSANWLRPSLDEHRQRFGANSGTVDFSGAIADSKAWRDVWSAGLGVGTTTSIGPVSDVVEVLAVQYRESLAAAASELSRHDQQERERRESL